MKIIERTQLYTRVFVSLRDYEVEEAIKAGGAVIFHEGKKMTLTKQDLKKKRHQLNPELQQSKYGNDYYLYDYLWKPDERQKDVPDEIEELAKMGIF